MITSIFSKSKPINIILIVVFIGLLFIISNYSSLFIDLNSVINGFAKLIIAIFSVFILDFIISKNILTTTLKIQTSCLSLWMFIYFFSSNFLDKYKMILKKLAF